MTLLSACVVCLETKKIIIKHRITSLQKPASNEYQERLKGGHSTDQTVFSLSWDIEELKTLNSKGCSIHHEMLTCMEHVFLDCLDITTLQVNCHLFEHNY